MADFLTKQQRSKHMGLVRSRNTRFELDFLRQASAVLYPLGYRYRKHCRWLVGTPDIAFAKHRVAVFLDSDFWHGRNYKTLAPRMNPAWCQKIERNMARDREVARKLRRAGWSVLRFGERQIKKRPHVAIERITRTLANRAKSRVDGRLNDPLSTASARHPKSPVGLRCYPDAAAVSRFFRKASDFSTKAGLCGIALSEQGREF